MALAWTEAVTLFSEGPVPDDIYAKALEYFTKEELVNLTLAIVTINGWNRLSIAFHAVPGEVSAGGAKEDRRRVPMRIVKDKRSWIGILCILAAPLAARGG